MNQTKSSSTEALANRQFCIVSVGDVSFDWVWFHVSDEERNENKQDKSLAWERGRSIAAAAMHGGAWLIEAFAFELLKASRVDRFQKKPCDFVYSYQRLPTTALRAGHPENFVHSITHFDLFSSQKRDEKIKFNKDKVYRRNTPSFFFGPRPSQENNSLHLPKIKAISLNEYEDSYSSYISSFGGKLNLASLQKPSETFKELYTEPCPYPDTPLKIFLVLDEGNGFAKTNGDLKFIESNSSPSRNAFILLLTDPEQLKKTGNHSERQLPESAPPKKPPPFWEAIKEAVKEKIDVDKEKYPKEKYPLVIVLSSEHLRAAGIDISKGISWERTAYDLTKHIRENPFLQKLAKGSHLVIRLGLNGALHYNNTVNPPVSLLYYDSNLIEGDENSAEGRLPGYSALLAATIAVQLLEEIDDHVSSVSSGHSEIPDSKELATILIEALDKGISQGIINCRTYHCYGVGNEASSLRDSIENWDQSLARGLNNNSTIANNVPICVKTPSKEPICKNEPSKGPVCKVEVVDNAKWTILGTILRNERTKVSQCIVQLGFQDACKEAGELARIPVLKFKELMTVDREEIESYRSIRNLFFEYHRKRTQKPLSIAVFGPPGSGKSFGIKKIAQNIPEMEAVPVECNLSQFNKPDELALAFIRSRDDSLQGKIPIIIFDEFDCEFQGLALGWLKYFLSPMQDGEFKHGEAMHHIGKAIFVFAGGIYHTYQGFCHDDDKDEQSDIDFRRAKGLDFISRLRGFINVIGPDRRSKDDELFIMRRALVLRSLLEKNYKHLVRNKDPIDTDVLRAMLKVSSYKHGVRSMEAIFEMSTLGEAEKFEKSHLPSDAQLDMHVDSYEFTSLMKEDWN